jgi:hypothetical protein
MATKAMYFSLMFVAFLCLFAQIPHTADARDWGWNWDWEKTTADVCRWTNTHIGWACDNEPFRKMWRGYNSFWYGVTDCNSLCQQQGRHGGQCLDTGNHDKSSWCPDKGSTCTCY